MRTRQWLPRGLRRLTGLLVAPVLAVGLAPALTGSAAAAPAQPVATVAAGATLDGTEDDLGARSLREDSWSTAVLEDEDVTRAAPVYPMTPPMKELYRNPAYYDDGCHASRARTTVIPGCVYGDVDGAIQVAVLGNSKVGHYFPALEEIALREGWALHMFTKTSCDFVKDAPPTPDYPECDAFNDSVREHLKADPPDLVITGGMRREMADGFAHAWTWLEKIGVEKTVALWDTPVPVGSTPSECIADALQSGTDLMECAIYLPDYRSGNPSLREAAEQVDSVTYIDLRDWVCPETDLTRLCVPVIGRAQIYADGSHLSQGYAATLTDPLHQRLFEAGFAEHRPSVDRVAGVDRYATAAALADGVEPGGRVLVASGLDYPDALAAAAKAGHTDSAVLLTQADNLPNATRAALERLDPSEIVVAGGTTAVTGSVLQELRELSPDVHRVAGTDRYATAAEIATIEPVTRGAMVYIATGDGFADALAAAAQAGQRDAAILLVQQERIPVATREALSEIDPQLIVVAGGESAVSDAVVSELQEFSDWPVQRRGGDDRYATAAALAGDTPAGSVLHVGVSTTFADSLAAAPASAAARGAVLLVAPDRVPASTAGVIERVQPGQVVLTGGPSAVTEQVKRALIRLVD